MKGLQNGAKDLGRTVEKSAKMAGRTIQNGARDFGRTAEKAIKTAGRTAETGAKMAGRTAETGVKMAGRAAEAGAKTAGRELMKTVKAAPQITAQVAKMGVKVGATAGVGILTGGAGFVANAGATAALAQTGSKMAGAAATSAVTGRINSATKNIQTQITPKVGPSLAVSFQQRGPMGPCRTSSGADPMPAARAPRDTTGGLLHFSAVRGRLHSFLRQPQRRAAAAAS